MIKKLISLLVILSLVLCTCPFPASAQGEAGSVVSAGGNSTFIIKKDGSLWGAGKNEFGQIGTGSKNTVGTFTKILDNVSSVSAAQYHTVALKRDGTLWGFGNGSDRRLPDSKSQLVPVKILDDVKMAAAGTYYTAAVKTDGSLWICGNFGLGDGNSNSSAQFEKSLDKVRYVFAGDNNCLVIKEDDSLWIWGDNNSGQIGNGTESPVVLTATKVMEDVVCAAAGVGIMAIKKDGSLWMWGTSGKIPVENGDAEKSSVPAKIMDNALQCCMSADNTTYFVLKRDGTVWGFGSGHVMNSLLGKEARVFTKITDNAAAISSESRHLAVVKKDLTLWTGGQSIGGRLGYGNTDKYDHHKLTQIITEVLDVPAAWALAEVREAEYRKLVPPAMQSEYGRIVTRSEFCTLAITCIEQSKQMTVEEYMKSKGIEVPSSSPFLDIGNLAERARKDIMAAYALEIVAGTSATTFQPNNPITREQAAKMLTAAAAALGENTNAATPAFADAESIAAWAKPYIGFVFDAKIMGGVGSGKFDPKGGYQRQQAYMTMLRLYKKVTGIG
jgi:alpha-tubulin suppressor-like RCC1 family protein